MTTSILLKEQIKSEILKVLSGYCFDNRQPDHPKITILSPWITNVKLELDREVYELDTMWFGHDFGISSMPIATALLYLKLDFGADITLVTLPPLQKNYPNNSGSVKFFLDFLDEIGCKIYVNSNLHTKLILSNDLAVLGSFNLTTQALWEREEIGISLDDLGNLRALEDYAGKIVSSSPVYGYTGKIGVEKGGSQVTRGWLLDKMIEDFYLSREKYPIQIVTPSDYHEFLFFYLRTITAPDLLKIVLSDVDLFYMKLMEIYIDCKEFSDENKVAFLKYYIGYEGEKLRKTDALNYLKTKFAREQVPKVQLWFN